MGQTTLKKTKTIPMTVHWGHLHPNGISTYVTFDPACTEGSQALRGENTDHPAHVLCNNGLLIVP